jgi:SAM-dependent MidA family methyltransferase
VSPWGVIVIFSVVVVVFAIPLFAENFVPQIPLFHGTTIEYPELYKKDHMPVSELIIEKIRNEGPVTFRDFMEMALYYPGLGYYTSAGDRIGRSGDFYTSPYLSTLFGEMIAGQMEEMWQLLDRQPFTIVEQGAGTGLLCRDILRRLQANKEMYDDLNYVIIERNNTLRQRETNTLPSKVIFCDTIRDLPPINGCIFSNELIDNFSVHGVVMQEELMEVFVDYKEGRFVETLRPAAEALKAYLKELEVNLPPGFRTEINLQAMEWIKDISQILKKGFVMTIDYGHPSSDLYSQSRKTGTLVCYHRHRVNPSPYEHVGEQDITTHVNFSALNHWGRNHGLECCGYTNQTFFLQGLGLARHLRKMEEAGRSGSAEENEKFLLIRTLLMEMGNKFKVLIQRKGIHPAFLSGLQFPQRLV